MLLNFRRHPIGLTADIEKAFHEIIKDPKDRDTLRFLWIDDVSKPSGRQFEVSSTNKTLTKRAKHQFCVLSNLTRQWQRDYLLSLQERRCVKLSANSNDNARKVKGGDIVILKEEGTARCLWKLAKVTETLTRKKRWED